jgi:hypothetical protein
MHAWLIALQDVLHQSGLWVMEEWMRACEPWLPLLLAEVKT